jgi:hypothetical protein
MSTSQIKDDIITAARHEAAHAVMRFLRGMNATAISYDPQKPGAGFCAGTLTLCRPDDLLLLCVAGYAYEGRGKIHPHYKHTSDWMQALDIIAEFPYLGHYCVRPTGKLKRLSHAKSVAARMVWAWQVLQPHEAKILALADALLLTPRCQLTAANVRRILAHLGERTANRTEAGR